MKRLLEVAFLVCMVAPVAGQSYIKTLPDIVGTGATVAITGATISAQWIQIIAPSSNISQVRWGDSTVSATRGQSISPGGAQFLPGSGLISYDLSTIYVYIAIGDKVSVAWRS